MLNLYSKFSNDYSVTNTKKSLGIKILNVTIVLCIARLPLTYRVTGITALLLQIKSVLFPANSCCHLVKIIPNSPYYYKQCTAY